MKSLKGQVDAYRLRLAATEALAESRRQEAEATNDRMMAKDHNQVLELKRLREQLGVIKSAKVRRGQRGCIDG